MFQFENFYEQNYSHVVNSRDFFKSSISKWVYLWSDKLKFLKFLIPCRFSLHKPCNIFKQIPLQTEVKKDKTVNAIYYIQFVITQTQLIMISNSLGRKSLRKERGFYSEGIKRVGFSSQWKINIFKSFLHTEIFFLNHIWNCKICLVDLHTCIFSKFVCREKFKARVNG